MRSYIFSDMERRRLRCGLEAGEEDGAVQRVFVQVRRNLDRLTGDVGLLVEVCRRLREEGRMAGRGRLPDGFGRRSR